jgi:8-oxo-dGTP pyrophosphatase MutT (NUDIX family)
MDSISAFLTGLSSLDKDELIARGKAAQQHPPPTWIRWSIDGCLAGVLPPNMALELHRHVGQEHWQQEPLHWNLNTSKFSDLGEGMRAFSLTLKRDGKVSGWRDELYDFYLNAVPIFTLERALFRPLGAVSQAVHINGFSLSGKLWCARRAQSKQTDPGLLDNLSAGGLAAGEQILACATRELWEEAGLQISDSTRLPYCGVTQTSRQVPEGWHDERLHVYNLCLNVNETPKNRDGEVSEFVLLDAQEFMRLVREDAFTQDAVAALALGLGL